MEIKLISKHNSQYNIKRIVLCITLFINSIVLFAQSNNCCNSKSELATYLSGYWKGNISDSINYSCISFKNNEGKYYNVENIEKRKVNKDYATLEIRKEGDLWLLTFIMKTGGIEGVVKINNLNEFTWQGVKYERILE